MKVFLKVVLPCAIALVLGVELWRTCSSQDRAFSDQGLLEADAHELSRTRVSAHLETPIRAGTSVLWCGTFQLAWNEACSLVGEDLHFVGEPAMVALLNKKAFSKDDLDDASYVAVADFVRNDVHSRIRKDLKRKFRGAASPTLIPPKTLSPRPQDIVAYSYLFKNLEFETPFERLEAPLRFGDSDISCFGIGAEYKPSHESLYTQILILDYRGPNDFAIELRTKSEGDRLILAKVEPGETLAATVATVWDRIEHVEAYAPTSGDVLKVPKLNFDVTRRYGELEGLKLQVTNPQIAKDLMVLSAVQNTRFQMDEKGVKLRSESHFVIGCAGNFPPEPMHVMIFDKPFLIMLERADAKAPYFALWVDNAELLVKAR